MSAADLKARESFAPGRLWNLWDMLEHKAEIYCRLSKQLGEITYATGDRNKEPDIGNFADDFNKISGDADKLGMQSVAAQMERVYAHIHAADNTDHQIEPGTLHGLLRELATRMEDELKGRLFFAISPPMQNYYTQKIILFGDNVEKNFPQMSEDIAESGRCLAVNRSTAAVFHLMRVMELAVQHLGEELGVNLAHEKRWQNILDEVNKTIKLLDHKVERTKKISSAASLLYTVKVAWRNEVMHPKQTYTEEDAERIFTCVKYFVSDLALI